MVFLKLLRKVVPAILLIAVFAPNSFASGDRDGQLFPGAKGILVIEQADINKTLDQMGVSKWDDGWFGIHYPSPGTAVPADEPSNLLARLRALPVTITVGFYNWNEHPQALAIVRLVGGSARDTVLELFRAIARVCGASVEEVKQAEWSYYVVLRPDGGRVAFLSFPGRDQLAVSTDSSLLRRHYFWNNGSGDEQQSGELIRELAALEEGAQIRTVLHALSDTDPLRNGTLEVAFKDGLKVRLTAEFRTEENAANTEKSLGALIARISRPEAGNGTLFDYRVTREGARLMVTSSASRDTIRQIAAALTREAASLPLEARKSTPEEPAVAVAHPMLTPEPTPEPPAQPTPMAPPASTPVPAPTATPTSTPVPSPTPVITPLATPSPSPSPKPSPTPAVNPLAVEFSREAQNSGSGPIDFKLINQISAPITVKLKSAGLTRAFVDIKGMDSRQVRLNPGTYQPLVRIGKPGAYDYRKGKLISLDANIASAAWTIFFNDTPGTGSAIQRIGSEEFNR